jgi:hypothetical protein
MHDQQLLAEFTGLAGAPCDSGPEGDYGPDGQDRWDAETAVEYIDHAATMIDILREPPSELPSPLNHEAYISEVEDLVRYIQTLLGMMITYQPKTIAPLIGPHLRDPHVRPLLLEAIEDVYAEPLLPWLIPLVDEADQLTEAELTSLTYAIRSTGSRKVRPLYDRLAATRTENAAFRQALEICYRSLGDREFVRERKRRRKVIEQGFARGTASYWKERNRKLAREYGH